MVSVERTNLIKHLVALVQNEGLDVAQGEDLVANERIQTTRCTNNDVGASLLVLDKINVLLDGSATIENAGLDIWKVLAETSVFVLDLVCQLSSVAHDKDRAFPSNGLQLVQGGENEDCSLTKT
jgi:hypothetical protein